MGYRIISDFFDLRPSREVRFDVSRSLSFIKTAGTRSDIPLITEDNMAKLQFNKTDSSSSNIKLRIS
tara:strand:- start:57 stop:257 length:201 start_codon:yes stop_codon:yes gene_type:complete